MWMEFCAYLFPQTFNPLWHKFWKKPFHWICLFIQEYKSIIMLVSVLLLFIISTNIDPYLEINSKIRAVTPNQILQELGITSLREKIKVIDFEPTVKCKITVPPKKLWIVISCFACSLTQKMEMICSSKTDICQTTWHCNPEDPTVWNYLNLKEFCVL